MSKEIIFYHPSFSLGDYEYSRSPSGYAVVRWTSELPTVGHSSMPSVEEVWNENENPYTGKKAF